jgi:hypothetical protein
MLPCYRSMEKLDSVCCKVASALTPANIQCRLHLHFPYSMGLTTKLTPCRKSYHVLKPGFRLKSFSVLWERWSFILVKNHPYFAPLLTRRLPSVKSLQDAGSDLAFMLYGKCKSTYILFIGTSISFTGLKKELCIAQLPATHC